MLKAPKTKQEVDKEIALTGTYAPVFEVGDYLVSTKIKNLSKTKNPSILQVEDVHIPFGGLGRSSYRVFVENKGKRSSIFCCNADTRYRRLSDLESAIFLDEV